MCLNAKLAKIYAKCAKNYYKEVYKTKKFAKLCEKKLCELCVNLCELCGKKLCDKKKQLYNHKELFLKL
ncbi:hypothetical protein HYN86_10890 [Flavobacterium fluviale]|uniref:Uncharacterized protein n=1 Tax=Flavobacterium fluviale TaxID=2249356 RepID=A0A344LT31_9FLAO|nr:hypothetical protein HYN86_10890 [Flavobacterium fluviale]